MSKRYKSAKNGEGMLKEAWSWVKDAEAGLNVRIVVEMKPTGRVGVWSVCMRALNEVPGRKGAQLASNVREWPAAREMTYEGAFFAQVMDLCRMLDELALDVVGVTRNAPQEG